MGLQPPQENLLVTESQPAPKDELVLYERNSFYTHPLTPPQRQIEW